MNIDIISHVLIITLPKFFKSHDIMKKLLRISAACCALVLALSACHSSGSDSESASEPIAKNGEINTFEISQSIKTSSATYAITGMPDSCHITLSASITWPRELGKYDIHVLQDSILKCAFPTYSGHDIDDAIKHYIESPAEVFDNDSTLTFKMVDSATESINSYTCDVTMSMLEITLDYVTYRADYSAYLGGAHPMWSSDIFTYAFSQAQVLTLANLFNPGYEKALLPIVTQAVADELSVSTSELQGMLLNDMFISPIVYLYNGMIVFHYNPYDILPYAAGAIEAKVAPYEVSDILTPAAKTLLVGDE